MRTKSRAGGRRKLPRPFDPPPPSSTFPLAMLSNQNTNMLETSEKEVDDGVEDADWLKNGTCIRCDERGSLLICNVSDCPIAIHANCVSYKPTFDDEGNFYCPYCSYKRALIQSTNLEKKVVMAKKALSSFIGSGVSIGNNSEQKDGMPREVEDDPVHLEYDQHVEKDSTNTKSRIVSDNEGDHPNFCEADDSDIDRSESDPEATKDFTTIENSSEAKVDSQVELSQNAIYAGGDTLLKLKSRVKAKAHKVKRQQKSGFPRRLARATDEEIKRDGAKNAEEVSTSKILGENHDSVEHFKKTRSEMVSDDDNSPPDPLATDVRDSPETENELPKDFMSKECFSEGDNDGRTDERELPVNTNLGSLPKHAGGEAPLKRKRRVKAKACKIKKQHNSHFPRRSPRALNKEIEKDPANKFEDAKSKMSKEDLTSVKKIRSPILSNAKRRRLQWTTEEEEMLREGVHAFSPSVNKNLPWRKILDFGNHVFDMTRSPVDLKDKWRKIQARESFSEK